MGRLLGLDIGERRIGAALSDPTGLIASPLAVIPRPTDEGAIQAIMALAEEHEVEGIVAGLPLTLRGEIGPQARAVQDFLDKLSPHLSVPLLTWDERFSTTIAERAMLEAGLSREERRRRRDTVAAVVILQSYLDSAKRPSSGAPGQTPNRLGKG